MALRRQAATHLNLVGSSFHPSSAQAEAFFFAPIRGNMGHRGAEDAEKTRLSNNLLCAAKVQHLVFLTRILVIIVSFATMFLATWDQAFVI